MAKYYKTYVVSPKYTTPEECLTFEFYKSGFWDGMGDISYYMAKLGDKRLYKKEFFLSEFDKHEEYIKKLIGFIESEEFDILSKKEYDFVQSEEFYYICNFLFESQYQLNHDYTSINFVRRFDYFTINDVGQFKGSGNRKNTITVRDYKTDVEDEFYVGRVSLSKNQSSILIPVVNFQGEGRVEIKEIKTSVNLFKCLCFALKISLLCSFIGYFPVAEWEDYFYTLGELHIHLMKKFNFYKVL